MRNESYKAHWIVPALAVTPIALAQPSLAFTRDIAPIVYQNCLPCHRPGQHAPFSLLTYEDVKTHAAQIADVTRRGSMPPWLPEHGYGDFAGERRLTAKEIETIARWVTAGVPEGPVAELPPAPAFNDEWQLGKPDLVLEAQGSFELPPSGPEVYWNFIFTPDLKARRWIRAIEIRPNQGTSGASCQPLSRPCWNCSPAGIRAWEGLPRYGPGHHAQSFRPRRQFPVLEARQHALRRTGWFRMAARSG